MLDILISSVLITNNDGQDRCFLESQRNCFSRPIIVTIKNNSEQVTPGRNSGTGNRESIGNTSGTDIKRVLRRKLQGRVSALIKHN